jgi:multidrug efflux pump
VLGGMISATLLGIFFVPLFFVLIRRIFSRKAVAQVKNEKRPVEPVLES